jgi:hypothetical protein
MKKLSLLYSLFSGCNRTKLSLMSVLLFALAFDSCKSRSDISEGENGSNEISSSTPLITVKEEIAAGWIPLSDSRSSSSETLAWLGGDSCIESTIKLKTKLITGFNAHSIVMEQSWDKNSDITIAVDGVTFSVPGTPLNADVKSEICKSIQSQGGTVVIPTAIASSFKSSIESALAAVAPDCRGLETSTEGWVCSLPSVMPQSAIVAVEDFQQGMIRRWSRQPYILARRAGVTMTLAKAATNLAIDANVHKFCQLLKFSLPEELPLVMTSSRWQKSLCDGNDKQRRESAFYGLAKSVEELAMIRQIYESTSRVGVFSLKIPSSTVPGHTAEAGLQPLRVTITPDAEVTERLIEIAEVVLGRPRLAMRKGNNKKTASLNKPIGPVLEQRIPLCWHPIFSDSKNLMRVADSMRLTGVAKQNGCNLDADGASDPMARYLTQSLMSEAEFVMDNGQTKLLRLPEGQYRYTIQALPQNPVDTEEVDDETPTSNGDFIWGAVREHSIREWK